MNDRDLMENLLLLEKGVCDLYLHGAIECSRPDVHRAFTSSLSTALELQEQLYSHMEQKGWYQTEQAPQNKLSSVKMKFGASSSQC